MTELPFEPDAPLGDYGRWRNARWLAGMQARADDMTQAAMQAYGQSDDRRVPQEGQAGMYGQMTPYDRGAANAARAATTGSEWGQTRALERNGGAFTHHLSGPAPARVSLVGQDAPPGYQRDENPLVRWSRENR